MQTEKVRDEYVMQTIMQTKTITFAFIPKYTIFIL